MPAITSTHQQTFIIPIRPLMQPYSSVSSQLSFRIVQFCGWSILHQLCCGKMPQPRRRLTRKPSCDGILGFVLKDVWLANWEGEAPAEPRRSAEIRLGGSLALPKKRLLKQSLGSNGDHTLASRQGGDQMSERCGASRRFFKHPRASALRLTLKLILGRPLCDSGTPLPAMN